MNQVEEYEPVCIVAPLPEMMPDQTETINGISVTQYLRHPYHLQHMRIYHVEVLPQPV